MTKLQTMHWFRESKKRGKGRTLFTAFQYSSETKCVKLKINQHQRQQFKRDRLEEGLGIKTSHDVPLPVSRYTSGPYALY